MRRLLARHLMRSLWRLLLKQGNDPRYGSIGTRYNIVCLIPTILGGHSGWEPDDIKEEFSVLVNRGKITHRGKGDSSD